MERTWTELMVARMGLGLLLLALLLPTQIYSNQTAIVPVSNNSSQHASAAPSPTNATSTGNYSALQSAAGLLAIWLSLLQLYC
uniref:signal transducer CD24-like n=1 Tax=Jaculus jaculus TaxID=51337 RepID=UPI001E1B2449|nr:signal transducer CD24-like [Jaculus jaculus]